MTIGIATVLGDIIPYLVAKYKLYHYMCYFWLSFHEVKINFYV
jgi:hypothetical protein